MTLVEASKEGEANWVKTIIDNSRDMLSFQESCTPGYYNNEGKPMQAPQNNPYGGGALNFFKLMKKWRDKGDLQGLELNSNNFN